MNPKETTTQVHSTHTLESSILTSVARQVYVPVFSFGISLIFIPYPVGIQHLFVNPIEQYLRPDSLLVYGSVKSLVR
jgi:hypothetical protein